MNLSKPTVITMFVAASLIFVSSGMSPAVTEAKTDLTQDAPPEDPTGSALDDVKPDDSSEDTKGSALVEVKAMDPIKASTKPKRKRVRAVSPIKGSTTPKRKRLVGGSPAADAFAARLALKIYSAERPARLAAKDSASLAAPPEAAPDPKSLQTMNDQSPSQPTLPSPAAVALQPPRAMSTDDINDHNTPGKEMSEDKQDQSDVDTDAKIKVMGEALLEEKMQVALADTKNTDFDGAGIVSDAEVTGAVGSNGDMLGGIWGMVGGIWGWLVGGIGGWLGGIWRMVLGEKAANPPAPARASAPEAAKTTPPAAPAKVAEPPAAAPPMVAPAAKPPTHAPVVGEKAANPPAPARASAPEAAKTTPPAAPAKAAEPPAAAPPTAAPAADTDAKTKVTGEASPAEKTQAAPAEADFGVAGIGSDAEVPALRSIGVRRMVAPPLVALAAKPPAHAPPLEAGAARAAPVKDERKLAKEEDKQAGVLGVWHGIQEVYPGGEYETFNVVADERQCKVKCELAAQCKGIIFTKRRKCRLYDRSCFLYSKPCGHPGEAWLKQPDRAWRGQGNGEFMEALTRRGPHQEKTVRAQVCAGLGSGAHQPKEPSSRLTQAPVQQGAVKEEYKSYESSGTSLKFRSVGSTSVDDDLSQLSQFGGQVFNSKKKRKKKKLALCKDDKVWVVKLAASKGGITEQKVTALLFVSHQDDNTLCLMAEGEEAIYALVDNTGSRLDWYLVRGDDVVKYCGKDGSHGM